MITTETIQSPNFKKVLSGWLGKEDAENILSQPSLTLPYWFDEGICHSIANEVAILDHNDKELEEWGNKWMPAIELARLDCLAQK